MFTHVSTTSAHSCQHYLATSASLLNFKYQINEWTEITQFENVMTKFEQLKIKKLKLSNYYIREIKNTIKPKKTWLMMMIYCCKNVLAPHGCHLIAVRDSVYIKHHALILSPFSLSQTFPSFFSSLSPSHWLVSHGLRFPLPSPI